MKTEKNLTGMITARRGAVEDLSPEEIASREQERQELLAHLAAQEEAEPEPEQRPDPTPEQLREFGIISAPDFLKMKPEELALATGIGDHAKVEATRDREEDEERLRQIVAGLAPFKAMVVTAFQKCQTIAAEWADFLREMRSVDWRAFGQRHPRGAPLARRIADVTNGLSEATRLIDYAHRTHDDLLARINGVTLGRVQTDRLYLPEVRWEAELFVNIPKGISDVLWKLRRDAGYLKEALDRLAGEVPVEPSEDARATAATRAENFMIARAEITPLPADESKMPKLAPGRVKDASPFA